MSIEAEQHQPVCGAIVDPAEPARTSADRRFGPPGVLGTGARPAFEIMDELWAALPIDSGRIYITGHSMGGAATWRMIAQRPYLFAAPVKLPPKAPSALYSIVIT